MKSGEKCIDVYVSMLAFCLCNGRVNFSLLCLMPAMVRPLKNIVHSDLNSHMCYDFFYVFVCPSTEIFGP